MRLTKTVVQSVKYPHGGGRRFHALWDDDVKGFGLRVHPSGAKTFVFTYRLAGRKRWLSLGDFGPLTVQEARRRALQARAQVSGGVDPGEERRRRQQRSLTLSALSKEFMADKVGKLKPSTIRSYQQLLDGHVIPALGHLRPAAVTEDDAVRLHRRLEDSPYQANRALFVLSALMKLAIRRSLCTADPCAYVKRYREHARKRFLSSAELGRLGDALRRLEMKGVEVNGTVRTLSAQSAAALRLLALTGCRVREILTLRWSDVDWERGFVHLRDAKRGPRSFPLTAPVLGVLDTVRRAAPEGEWVVAGQRAGRHLSDLARPWRAACEVAGIDNARLHDLRHSVGAWSASSGDSLLVVGALLGHRSPASTARYAHLSMDPVREAAERVAAGIASAMDVHSESPAAQDGALWE